MLIDLVARKKKINFMDGHLGYYYTCAASWQSSSRVKISGDGKKNKKFLFHISKKRDKVTT
jgi:hypothetical protein